MLPARLPVWRSRTGRTTCALGVNVWTAGVARHAELRGLTSILGIRMPVCVSSE